MYRFPKAKERVLEIMAAGRGVIEVTTSWQRYELEVTLVESKPYFKWGYDAPRNTDQIEAYIRFKLEKYLANSPGDISQWKDEWKI